MRYLLLLLVLLSAGCGYHFPGTSGAFPSGVKSVYLPLFVNQTSETRLENRLSSDLSEVLSRNGNVSQVESRQQAEGILEGTITSYSTSAVSYDSSDDISEYRATMQVAVILRSVADGRLLWQGLVSRSEEYLAADDKNLQDDYENQAIEEISQRVAEDILSNLLTDF